MAWAEIEVHAFGEARRVSKKLKRLVQYLSKGVFT
jgi:hypothetical protein